VDPALGAARPVLSALPWMMSASGAEIESTDGSRDSWWSVWFGGRGAAPGGSGDEGRRRACSVRNRRCTTHGSGDTGRWASDDGGPAPLGIGDEWV
jgi:hypothetical protein